MTPESAAASNAAASATWGCHVFTDTDKRRQPASPPQSGKSNSQRVQEYMRKSGKPAIAQDVADAVDLTRQQVNSVLNGLSKRGHSRRTGQRSDSGAPYWVLT